MNDVLPIVAYRDQIVQTIASNPVTIITTETGAGKTTMVPQFLYEAGYSVVMTQPQRLSVTANATRIAEGLGTQLGDIVGWRTSEGRQDSKQTQVLLCTDGLLMVRELLGHSLNTDRPVVLIIDEAHLWNLNIEVLVAWVKHRQSEGEAITMVLLSATIDTEALSVFFNQAPVISVPGRLHKIEQRFIRCDNRDDEEQALTNTVRDLIRDGRNVLVFRPGKNEIARVIDNLANTPEGASAKLLPLHGELSREQRNQIFSHYPVPKVIVSTNIAQTSVTIDDIDAVVDTGDERRIELRDGVEGLYLGAISKADCKQRAGRAGRTKAGVYVLCADLEPGDRPEFPTPEIMRIRLDQMVLRLAVSGMDASVLEFFHQPNQSTLVAAKESLQRLGAMEADGSVTKIGEKMSRLPVDVHYARMIVAIDDPAVLSDIITLVACLEAGGIKDNKSPFDLNRTERESDALAELNRFFGAAGLNKSQQINAGIHAKQYAKAKELRLRLAKDLNVTLQAEQVGDRTVILKALASGMVDHVYQHSYDRRYQGVGGQLRELDKKSVVSHAYLVVGKPFDLEIKTRHGAMTMNLLTSVSKIDVSWLDEIAPHLINRIFSGQEFDTLSQSVVNAYTVVFNGTKIGREVSPVEAGPEATRTFARAIAQYLVPHPVVDAIHAVFEQAVGLYWSYGVGTVEPTIESLVNLLAERLGTAYTTEELDAIDLRIKPTDFLPEELVASLPDLSPEEITSDGVTVKVTYAKAYNGMSATIFIAEGDVERLAALPELRHTVVRMTVEAIDEFGHYVFSASSLDALKTHVKEQAAQRARRIALYQAQDAYAAEIVRLREDLGVLSANGRNTGALSSLVDAANVAARSFGHGLKPATAVDNAIKQASAEVERLNGNGTELILSDILADRLSHPDMPENKKTLKKLDALAIRSNGYFEPLEGEKLIAAYRAMLGTIDRVDVFKSHSFRLNLEEYAPQSFIEEFGDALAPEKLSLEGGKGLVEYDVTYQYKTIDGESVAVGLIKIPMKTYERNAGVNGKVSGFPTLPHGIRLFVSVEMLKTVIAEGEVGDDIDTKIKKFIKGKRRSANTLGHDERQMFVTGRW